MLAAYGTRLREGMMQAVYGTNFTNVRGGGMM